MLKNQYRCRQLHLNTFIQEKPRCTHSCAFRRVVHKRGPTEKTSFVWQPTEESLLSELTFFFFFFFEISLFVSCLLHAVTRPTGTGTPSTGEYNARKKTWQHLPSFPWLFLAILVWRIHSVIIPTSSGRFLSFFGVFELQNWTLSRTFNIKLLFWSFEGFWFWGQTKRKISTWVLGQCSFQGFFVFLHKEVLALSRTPLDLSSWSFLTFLHHGIEEVERHLLRKFYKKIRRKSWSNVPPKLPACIGFLYKVVHKISRLRKLNRSREIEFNFLTAWTISMKFGTLVQHASGYKWLPQIF